MRTIKFRHLTLSFLVGLVSAFGALAQHDHDGHEQKPKDKDSRAATGILLLAHGGKENWNEEVRKIAAAVDRSLPVEIAFGMATKRNIRDAADRLVKRGATEIVVVPLFVSSHSSVITSTEYLLGLRKEAPADLAVFAKMEHGHGGHDSLQAPDKSFDPTTPIKTSARIRMLPALDRHPLVAEILVSRAAAISKDPSNEVVVLVAHGPVEEEENNLWLADMAALAKQMEVGHKFKRIEYLTVRDDAPDPIRSNATAELRRVVERAAAEGNRVLIVPLLLSYGGIEQGVKKRLEGLQYTIPDQGLLPDARLEKWVLRSVREAEKRR